MTPEVMLIPMQDLLICKELVGTQSGQRGCEKHWGLPERRAAQLLENTAVPPCRMAGVGWQGGWGGSWVWSCLGLRRGGSSKVDPAQRAEPPAAPVVWLEGVMMPLLLYPCML